MFKEQKYLFANLPSGKAGSTHLCVQSWSRQQAFPPPHLGPPVKQLGLEDGAQTGVGSIRGQVNFSAEMQRQRTD